MTRQRPPSGCAASSDRTANPGVAETQFGFWSPGLVDPGWYEAQWLAARPPSQWVRLCDAACRPGRALRSAGQEWRAVWRGKLAQTVLDRHASHYPSLGSGD